MRRWNPRDAGAVLRGWYIPESREGDFTGVQFWRDVSGNGYDFATASASRPQFASSIGGRPVTAFNATAGTFMLPAGANPMAGAASLSAHFVFKNEAHPPPVYYGAPLGNWGTDIPADHFPSPSGNFVTKFGSNLTRSYGNQASQTDVASGVIASLTAPNNGPHRFFLNGAAIGNSFIRPYQAAPNPALGRSTGYPDQPPFYWPGWIGEIVLCAASATTELQRLIEGYLAHKWATPTLASGHPYRLTPPYSRLARRGGFVIT